LKRGSRVVALLIALVGCSGKAQPAVDMMQADGDHRPGAIPVARPADPAPIPDEPEAPKDAP